ncbi:MAG: hypothetical protein DWP95_06205 [Proteobacteria bacterium]|nr:MAG: hypothetical protein DWP95_06205 [Pseudomonadota bacterium]
MQDDKNNYMLLRLVLFNFAILISLLIYIMGHFFPAVLRSGCFFIYKITHGDSYSHLELPLIFILAYLLKFNEMVKGVRLNIVNWIIGIIVFIILVTGIILDINTENKSSVFQDYLFPIFVILFLILIFSHSLVALYQIIKENKLTN